jgi:hypothetical protein
MKSPTLHTLDEFLEWANAQSLGTFGVVPQSYPAVCVAMNVDKWSGPLFALEFVYLGDFATITAASVSADVVGIVGTLCSLSPYRWGLPVILRVVLEPFEEYELVFLNDSGRAVVQEAVAGGNAVRVDGVLSRDPNKYLPTITVSAIRLHTP